MLAAPDPVHSPSPTGERPDDISLFELITPLVRHWRRIALTALVVGIVATVVVFLLPVRYTATVTFVPQAPKEASLLSSLGGLASQFGLTAPTGSEYSADFVTELLRSRHVLETTLRTPFAYPDDSTRSRPLMEYLELDGDTPAERRENALEQLADATAAELEDRTGIVTLSVELRSADLAARVANRMVAILNEFNVERRALQSADERRFTERRLDEARRDLLAAERDLQRFLQNNRLYGEFSPISFEARRLERQAEQRQELLLTLTRAYEEARLNEVRDTRVIVVIDPAEVPTKKSSPKRVLTIAIAVLLGIVGAVVWALLTETRRRVTTEERPDVREFLAAVSEVRERVGS